MTAGVSSFFFGMCCESIKGRWSKQFLFSFLFLSMKRREVWGGFDIKYKLKSSNAKTVKEDWTTDLRRVGRLMWWMWQHTWYISLPVLRSVFQTSFSVLSSLLWPYCHHLSLTCITLNMSRWGFNTLLQHFVFSFGSQSQQIWNLIPTPVLHATRPKMRSVVV